MSGLFYWTGATVWLGVALVALWLCWALILGVAYAVSRVRWSIRVAARRRALVKLHWRHLPGDFLRMTWEHFGGGSQGVTLRCPVSGATWRGIGDWTLPTPEPPK